jgi:hypothetical protein
VPLLDKRVLVRGMFQEIKLASEIRRDFIDPFLKNPELRHMIIITVPFVIPLVQMARGYETFTQMRRSNN